MLTEQDPNFERRADEITAGVEPYIRKHLLEKVSMENATTIIDSIQAYKSESNLNDYSIQVTIVVSNHLSQWHKNKKSFREMTRDDILAFLNRLRKSDEQDPLHHWVGTYSNNVITIVRFFKWLIYPMLAIIIAPLE